MLPKSTSKNEQKINGFKFFQQHLNILDQAINEPQEFKSTKPLSSSAVAMYIGIMSECSHTGLLDLGTSIAMISRKLGIAPQTGHDGLKELIAFGLILAHKHNRKTQYEVGGYDHYNRSREESRDSNDLSYFYVPFHIFNSGVIPKLVKSNSNRGLHLLLKLSNSFHRDLNRWGKDGTTLTMKHFKKVLNEGCAKRVRKVLDVLSPLFTFKPVDIQERKPRNTVDRIRKAVNQLWIKKYEIHISPACLIERKEMETDITQALKETEMQLKYMGFALKSNDRRGIHVIYRSYVREIAQYIKDSKLRRQLVRESVFTAMERLDATRAQEEIKNVGAFLNKYFKSFVHRFIKQNPGVLTDVMYECEQTGASYPKIVDSYLKTQAAL
ncbi:hypothetical protein [Rossellomorea marisflavi]|uniref:hypothetical protein n=1 Tax=Rossellomorea marisflavi TaxID=189381 RepID=UPI003D2F2D60